MTRSWFGSKPEPKPASEEDALVGIYTTRAKKKRPRSEASKRGRKAKGRGDRSELSSVQWLESKGIKARTCAEPGDIVIWDKQSTFERIENKAYSDNSKPWKLVLGWLQKGPFYAVILRGGRRKSPDMI